MTRVRFVSFLSIAVLFLGAAAAMAVAQDAKGCQDHPMFTRMANMRISNCTAADFDRFEFKTGKAVTDKVGVEGKRAAIRYQVTAGVPPPTAIAIIRNFQQAIRAIGGTVVWEDARLTTLKVTKNGSEVWTQVDTAWGGGYMLTIVEKQEMTQQIVASAAVFDSGLKASGHVEVPGIFFDTGKAELKPESAAAVEQVAKLLKDDPALKVYVVGHTDNVASLDLNTRLSQSRAEAVVQALVSKHGIAANRLIGRGAGPLAPVASNDSDEGRAKNRRVELVKQ